MKIAYLIIGLILSGGFIFYLTSCNDRSKTTEKITPQQDTSTVKIHQTEENVYDGLRGMAFSVTPDQLSLTLPADKTIVYGIVMDWGMSGAIASTVAYQTGDASLYLSSGGGVIGGGQHQNVSSAAKQFVALAQTYLDKATAVSTPTLPDQGVVKFYLLTNKGLFAGQEQMKNFENKSSAWLGLFNEGNKVLTELRLTSENK